MALYIEQRMSNAELLGRSKRERPLRRFVDGEEEDMQRAGVTEEDVGIRSERGRWSAVATLKGSSWKK